MEPKESEEPSNGLDFGFKPIEPESVLQEPSQVNKLYHVKSSMPSTSEVAPEENLNEIK